MLDNAMAWYNPLEWPGAATRLMYTQYGYKAKLLRHAASYVGAESVAKKVGDYEEFLLDAGDPMRVGKNFDKPIAKTSEERAQQSAEANRYTNSVVNEIAPMVEAKLSFDRDVISTATGAKLLKATKLVGFLPKYGIPWATEVSVDSAINYGLSTQNEAPMISWMDKTPILKDWFGDAHYAKGGTPDTHPDRLAYLASQNTGKASADAATSPTNPPVDTQNNPASPGNDNAQHTEPSFLAKMWKGFTGFFTALLEKISKAVQYVFGGGDKSTQLVASAPPVTNHPRTAPAEDIITSQNHLPNQSRNVSLGMS